MDSAALKAELLADPLGIGYGADVAAYSDGDAQLRLFDKLNAKDYALDVPIPIVRVLIWGAGNGVLAAIRNAAGDADSPVQAIAIAADTIMRGGVSETLDLTDLSVRAMVAPLVQAGIMTPEQETSLLSLQSVPASRAEVLFGPGTVIGGNAVYDALSS